MPAEHEFLICVPHLRRYARALHRNRDDADDLVQDTLERAWSKAALWGGVSDMKRWLLSIMHNLYVDRLRRLRLPTCELDEDTPEVAVPATQGDHLAVRDLQAALDLLPPEHKQVLLLVALEDMSYADIAAGLSIPIGTVMSRLSRARERLRLLMEGREQVQHLKVVK
jgi:RNA polymerase sigma-70 factor (ECF subfamily)